MDVGASCCPGVLPPAAPWGALGPLWVGLTLLGTLQPQQRPPEGPELAFPQDLSPASGRSGDPLCECWARTPVPEKQPDQNPLGGRRWGWKMTRWRLRQDQAPGEGTQAQLLGEALSTVVRGRPGSPEGWAGEGGVSPGLTPLLGTG
ncbi:PREDICTED: proline-rich protein 31 [Colobus angolensis palliatus]|uniref:proline-rich protein 31 n=1 Tax=Colobus angolensis palliatus TaxID=336983 RepID=UPI0005F441B5|nr:PREDICTED: proline-rich protein 31 [Colobus angolensis palliatus]